MVEAGGVHHIVVCLARGSEISKAAIKLLFELLRDGLKWNESTCRKLKQQDTAIFFLVMLLDSTDTELAEKAEIILSKLCDDDDNAISHAAAYCWYKPLVDRLCHG